MSSYTPDTDLWLERSRLAGMLLAAVSYGECPSPSALRPIQNRTSFPGVFFLLTIEAIVALVQRPYHGSQTVHHRPMLLGYIGITFVLATIGFAGNARFTEMIWIDLRDAPGGPAALILDEFNYWINVMSLAWYVRYIFLCGYCDRSHVIVTTSWNGSCKFCWFVPFQTWCMSRADIRTTASPLLRPLAVEETRCRTHVHTLYSHDRCVCPISQCIWINALHYQPCLSSSLPNLAVPSFTTSTSSSRTSASKSD